MARRWFLDRSHQAGIPSVNLRKLLPEARFLGCKELEISGCAADPRRLEPGQAYIQLHSAKDRSLHQALDRGAIALIVETPDETTNALQVVVPDARIAHAHIAHALAGFPSQRLAVYAVMGRLGRVAAAHSLHAILEAAGRPVGYVGSNGWSDGSRHYPPPSTPIEPANLAEMLAVLEERGCAAAVVEVTPENASNRLLEATHLAGVIFTPLGNLEPDLKAREHQRGDHARIARLVQPGAPIVAAADDAEASLLSAANLRAVRLTFSNHKVADLSWVAESEGPKGTTLTLATPTDQLVAEVSWTGAANHLGAAAAVTLAQSLGITKKAILQGLEQADAIPGSLELLSHAQGIPIWRDQGTTPYELFSTLDSLRSLVPARLFCILCTPHQNRLHLARPLAEACEHLADQVILTLDTALTPDENLRGLRAWFNQAGRVRVEDDREQAITAALEIARPGDGILIAGPARSWLSNQQGRHALPLDDRQIIRRYLADQAIRRSA